MAAADEDSRSGRYNYDYAEPKFDYASPTVEYASPTLPQAPEPPMAMPTPFPAYQHTAHAQFDAQQQPPPPPGGPQPGYAQPGTYAHSEVNAHYADPRTYTQYGASPGPYQQQQQQQPPMPPSGYGSYPGPHEYTRDPPKEQPQHEYVRGPPKEHPHYATPSPFQYMDPPDDKGGAGAVRPPPSPGVGHARTHSFGGPPPPPSTGYHPGSAAPPPHAMPAQSAPYGGASVYAYAQPTQPSAQVEPGRGRDTRRPSVSYAQPTPQPPQQQQHQIVSPDYAKPGQYQYAQPDGRINYKYKDSKKEETKEKKSSKHEKKGSEGQMNVIEIQPGGGALGAPPSPGLGPRMHRLSVSGGVVPYGAGGVVPPGSPLLEAYRGTYQSISPMPSPIMLPSAVDDDIDSLDELTPLSRHGGSSSSDDDQSDSDDDDRRRARPRRAKNEKTRETRIEKVKDKHLDHSRDHHRDRERSRNREAVDKEREKEKKRHDEDKDSKMKKRVKFYDPEEHARALADALRHRQIESETLIAILPRLSHEQILQLRGEYKKHARVQGKGINIAKHLKMKLSSGAFGKVCYATALGKWESEAYWANFWYQSNTSRRELLIESLMGRTNAEMREIKAAFSDKRYGDSLEKCMRAELKADKFRTAVLLAVEEKRWDDSPYVYADDVAKDVRRLHDALVAREGGETAMIQVVVTRNDTHMREVLKVYEKTYRRNFAKEMLKKSTNLVVSVANPLTYAT